MIKSSCCQVKRKSTRMAEHPDIPWARQETDSMEYSLDFALVLGVVRNGTKKENCAFH